MLLWICINVCCARCTAAPLLAHSMSDDAAESATMSFWLTGNLVSNTRLHQHASFELIMGAERRRIQ